MDIGRLRYVDGWCGGYYTVDFTQVDLTHRPNVVLITNGVEYRAVYQVVTGADDDHGHEYPWSMTDIGILDGNLVSRFLSARELINAGTKITLRFLKRSNI